MKQSLTPLIFLLFVCGCHRPDEGKLTSSDANPEKHGSQPISHRKIQTRFDQIMSEIDKIMGGESWAYEEALRTLRGHPPGYRRVFCMWTSDHEIDNGGFSQYYGNGIGYMTMNAIEGYERIGAPQMGQILKSSLYVFQRSHPEEAKKTHFDDIPPGYFDGFVPIANTFNELDNLYYQEADKLPGSERNPSIYPEGAIDYYFERFPSDFGR